jgi:hypothetical protein
MLNVADTSCDACSLRFTMCVFRGRSAGGGSLCYLQLGHLEIDTSLVPPKRDLAFPPRPPSPLFPLPLSVTSNMVPLDRSRRSQVREKVSKKSRSSLLFQRNRLVLLPRTRHRKPCYREHPYRHSLRHWSPASNRCPCGWFRDSVPLRTCTRCQVIAYGSPRAPTLIRFRVLYTLMMYVSVCE